MRTRSLLTACCFLLLSCSSSEESRTDNSEASALKHLKQDKVTDNNLQAGDLTVRLIPTPLVAAEPAEAIVHGCRQEMTFSWSINDDPVNGASVSELSNSFFKRGDDVTLEVACGDNKAAVTETVSNSPPVISAVKFANSEILAGQALTVVPEAEDADGDPLEFIYQWTVNGVPLITIDGPVLPAEYVERNNEIQLDVTATDEIDDSEVFQGISFDIPNSPPQINSEPPLNFSTATYEYQVVAVDPDGDPLSFRLDQAPAAMTISSAGLITWPLNNIAAGEYPVSVVVVDSEGLQSIQSYTLTLSLPE